MNNPFLLSIIVPTYNEELGIEEFYRRTKLVVDSLVPEFSYEIIFVNDYSSDNTLVRLASLAKVDLNVKVLSFSRNFGNQAGITAGIDYAKGDLAIIIDDDLQDPPELIPIFINCWKNDYKVVYGVRPKRKGVNPIFQLLAKIFYRLLGKLSDTKIPSDTGDFRLIDRQVLDQLKKMREESRYYRGMVSWVGFKQIGVEYERDPRYAGRSTFSAQKYFKFAVNALTAFTDKPLYFSSILGFFITITSFVLAIQIIITKLIDPSFSIPGWPSLVVVILFFGGIQLLSIGVVSIYISKIFKEVKNRPLYIIEESYNLDQ
jgi:glycosyltransferase involved in cell wall biosynthesis